MFNVKLALLVLKIPISAGARGDVQNFGGCQAPVAPVLTQALTLNLDGSGLLRQTLEPLKIVPLADFFWNEC